MFRLKINTNTHRGNEKIANLSMTIGEALETEGVSVSGATVSLNGRILTAGDYGRTFADLNMTEGASAVLSVVVKADSAA